LSQFWSNASSLTFIETMTKTAEIQMNFFTRDHGDVSAFDGPGGVLAHAFYPIYGGELHWNGDESWTINSYQGTLYTMCWNE